jgi:2-polyprenyl-3-methyl-5-hydroxy-6-metoxy-1,4-benzoquinol methylase
MSSNFEVVLNCRICQSLDLQSILNLGEQPLANALIDSDKDKEIFAPLELIRCNKCTTMQLSVNVNPELMFKDYLWVTGTTKTALEHLDKLSELIETKCLVTGKSLLEVGCNDGSLLKILSKKSFSRLIGVDPAKNIIDAIDSPSLELYSEFFNLQFASEFIKKSNRVDIVIARNVFSHVPDIVSCLKAVNMVLSEDGIFIMEFHEASKIAEEFHYDSIYHEHTFYHSIRSVSEAAKFAGMQPFDIDFSPISGGSFILYFTKNQRTKTDKLKKAELTEIDSGVLGYEKWKEFAENSRNNMAEIKEYLSKNTNLTICGFGASARSSTLINAVGKEFLTMVGIADNNKFKNGKKSPGSHIRIESPYQIIDQSVDIVILFPFNFEKEIIEFLENELKWSGEIFLPLPNKPRVIRL